MADKSVSNNNTVQQNNNTQQKVVFIPKYLYAPNSVPCYYTLSHGEKPCSCGYLGINPEYIKALMASGFIP